MVWAYFLFCTVFLTTSKAYEYYPSYYTPSYHRRADNYQQRSYRVANERSIPYRSDAQRVHEDSRRVRPSDDMLRNGNLTYKADNLVQHYPNVTSRRGADLESAVVFPGPTSRRANFVPEIPKECEKLGYCEEIPNYPHEYVETLINDAGISKYFTIPQVTPEITQRRGPEYENKELCQYDERMVYPQAAKNLEGKWFIVLNKKKVKVQGFRAEVCKNIGKPCDSLVMIDPNFAHECNQKTAQRNIMGIDEQGNMVLETIETPSCCTCFIVGVVDYDYTKSRNLTQKREAWKNLADSSRQPGRGCDYIAYLDPIYRHECDQKFSQRLFVGVDRAGQMTMETIMTPSCCACFIKSSTPSDHLRRGHTKK